MPERLRLAAVLAVICSGLIALEAYLVFYDRVDTFQIEGKQAYEVAEFSNGGTVSHAFLMRGDGLQSVSVMFSSRESTPVRVAWTLWRGYPDQPSEMTIAFEDVRDIQLRPGRQWHSLELPRDSSSRDRWYTIRLRLLDPLPSPSAHVSVIASRDNPDRGGVLWVGEMRQTGSLLLRADRRGRTAYRQFHVVAEPYLPASLQNPIAQWAIVIVMHWALMVFAYALLSEALDRPDQSPASNPSPVQL